MNPAVRLLVLLAALPLAACQNQNGAPAERDRAPSAAPANSSDEPGGMMGDDGMMGDHGMMDRDGIGEMMRDMPDGMMSRGMMDRNMMRDMHVIHDLLMDHEKIRREVENIPGGVRTVTTSSDPSVTESIRTHVYQMKSRIEEGRLIRHMDPLFREIFEHHDKIDMRIEEVPGGVRVTETSADPQVALLIRQHARRAVSEFVERGMRRAMQPTPLPEGYHR